MNNTSHDIAPIIGLHVYLHRTKDSPWPFMKNLMQTAIIREGTAPHAASVRCSRCGRHRGWLPAQAVSFWLDTAKIFGPLDFVVLKDATSKDDEAVMGEAVAISPTTQQGAMVMGLGFSYGNGGGLRLSGIEFPPEFALDPLRCLIDGKSPCRHPYLGRRGFSSRSRIQIS